MYPEYCFWVLKTVEHVPGSGDLYAMDMLGLMGDVRTLS
jgi:hypothetical protein